jgi:signal transduction histidine kinase
MRRVSAWLWRCVWGGSLLLGLVIWLIYGRLPVDGATGDLESFTPAGFRVQWLLEERENGLQVGDIIVRAGGHTVDEWLSRAPAATEWRNGAIIPYEILRDGLSMTLQVQLSPVPLRAILERWGAQLATSIALVLVGSYVFWKRPDDDAARLFMLFCTTIAVQMWGDSYNFQYATLTQRPLFWFHFLIEYGSFILTYTTVLNFTLVFPAVHPLLKRFPRFSLFLIYLLHPLAVSLSMALSPSWYQALRTGSHVSWWVALAQVISAILAGLRSVRTADTQVSRAQIRWILWGAGVAMAITVPGYILPIAVSGRPLIPHPAVMLLTVFVPIVFAIPILRYRLFDIEIVINRTLVYGTLTAFLGGLYLLLVRLLTWMVQAALHRHDDTLVVFLATLSIAMAFNPVRQRVQFLIDRAFYRSRLDYPSLLSEMTERLVTSLVLDELAALLTTELPQRMQIEKAGLLVLDSEGQMLVPVCDTDHPALPIDHPLVESARRLGHPLMRLQLPSTLPHDAKAWLEQQQVELCIPLTVGNELVGLYNLGPKQSGRAYNAEEIHLLHLLGQQAAVGAQNSRLFHNVRRQADELEQAVARLQELDRLKSEFVQNVSHELRLPLALIRGHAELLAEGELGQLSPEQLKSAEIIARRSRMMGHMVEDIMLILLVEARAMVKEPVALDSLVRDAVTDIQVVTDQAGLELKTDIAADLPMMDGAAIPLRRALDNLLGNAVKFTPPGGTISVRLWNSEQQILLEVSDTGVGIPPEHQEHIFDRLYQVDGSMTRQHGGMGLGLALVKEIIEAHGGSVSVTSQLGQGSTFRLTIPTSSQDQKSSFEQDLR